MKRSKINLLLSKQNYQKTEQYFYALRYVVGILIIIFALSLGFVFYQLYSQQMKINDLLNKKKYYLESIKNKEDIEKYILILNNKYKVFSGYEKDDVKAVSYYNLLLKALSQNSNKENSGNESSISASLDTSTTASQSATFQFGKLTTFKLDKKRVVEFKVTFNNLIRFLDFIKFVESEDFLSYFEKLSLNSFTLSTTQGEGQIKKVEHYDLSLTGVFKQINENKN